MIDRVLNGRCLYTPNGPAREYAAVGCNFYRGCPYQCRYCYNRSGLTAKVMGVDHAVLENAFTKIENRPKKYRDLTCEEYAFVCFQQEVFKWHDYLRKTGNHKKGNSFFCLPNHLLVDKTGPDGIFRTIHWHE